ncbi:hypothetical protein DOTSEDRAFT_52406 [Dothistroma septosporum NZE10]|uniref:T6SS Phospholipase effector Tle1-like catalytic domain-containing protein n=1 Tax=Dothistroma septosporum (strain NZE10 / CBS 128990) TaxID=675120 RepID=N1PPZ7_DOTSN|nr:hypothetical protein DOTSEDRAFT_52406 [Dothistroma septosporum NZE10]
MSEGDVFYPAESTPVAEHLQNGIANHERVVPQLPREIRAVKDANSYKHHGRNIIVCLDGTGDKFDADNSNIVHFVSCLKKSDPSQSIYYQSGIGTYDGGGLSNGINAGLDMAVGSGLGVHIRDAYMYLMETFKEGDKISLFGFSRGAYTARCLAGMVHKVGLLPAHNSAQVPFAYEYYKDDTEQGWKMSADFKKTFCITVNIDFIGVFDSVGSIGFIPRKLPLSSTPTNRAVHFRHAMALDERRAKFKVCRYQQKASTGWKVLAEEKKAEKDDASTDVLEVWFSGCHADVGGGAVKNEVRHKLSQIPLRWMIRQCFDCNTGIIFKSPRLAEEGLDVHTLWPLYTQLPKPRSAPPAKDLLERKANGGLGPIHRRASVLEPVKHDDPMGMHHVKLWEDHAQGKHSSDWIPEQVEDYFDSMEGINDQLVQAKGWWVLEVWPVKVRIQPKDSDSWVKKVRCNMGRYRACPEQSPKVHWTVQERIEEKIGDNKVRADRKSVWQVVV